MPRDMIPDDELDRIFGPCETVDPNSLLDELRELRASMRAIERDWPSDDDSD